MHFLAILEVDMSVSARITAKFHGEYTNMIHDTVEIQRNQLGILMKIESVENPMVK